MRFGRDEYYIALLGVPSPTAPWMIQFGGHHLAINVTVVGSTSVMTPSTSPSRICRRRMDAPGRRAAPASPASIACIASRSTRYASRAGGGRVTVP